jgi:hypothetical protein
MVKLQEIQDGFNHKPNPDQPLWDLQFHEESIRWKVIGKKGGWWKCRDGDDATNAEKQCQLCHSDMLAKEKATDVRFLSRAIDYVLISPGDSKRIISGYTS